MGGTEDGDFIALRQRREAKKSEVVDTEVLRFKAIKQKVDPVLDYADNNNERPEVAEQWPAIEEAVKSDDVDKLSACAKSLGSYKFSEPELRLACKNTDKVIKEDKHELLQNCLHVALNGKHYKAATFLINTADEALLLANYEIEIKTILSKKSCLHILSEQSDNELTNLLLSKIKDENTLKQFLNRTVLSVMEGQIPRNLAAIHLAASLGNSQLVSRLVEMGVSPSCVNSKNDTPILWAARFGHNDTVATLLDLGASVNQENDKGSTALYWAVRYGKVKTVQLLCEMGKADTNQRRKLGLVCPVVLASAFGYDDILKILLKFGGQANMRINGGMTALHYAAMEGNPECIAVLMENGAEAEAVDEMGNTPLIRASQNNHLRCIAALISYGASIEAKNRSGTMVWDYAIASTDLRLLTALVNVIKDMKGGEEPYLFTGVNTPLHIAAKKGDCDKISCLLGLGLDPACTDTDGNTFLHLAAKENKHQVLEKFLQIGDLASKNLMGDRPLHIACRAGNMEAMKTVIGHSDISSVNNMGETALHVAAKSHLASYEMLSQVIEMMVKTTHWSLLDCSDNNGNTPLHSAAQAGRSEIISQMAFLNPMINNEEGNNPLHMAANRDNWKTLEVMLEVFNNTGKGFNLDSENRAGRSLLQLVACKGNYEMVSHLIDLGADLASQDMHYHTTLHSIVRNSLNQPTAVETYIKVYFAIVDKAAQWWCMKHELTYPDSESDLYRTYRRLCMQYLLGELTDLSGHSVIGFATHSGAVTMLNVILQTTNVYKFDAGNDYITYDVTNMTPKSMASAIADKVNPAKKNSKRQRKSRVGAVYDTKSSSSSCDLSMEQHVNEEKSLLEIIVSMEDQKAATDVLDMQPVQQLVHLYWSSYQLLFLALMLVHTVYMALFSLYFLPYMEIRVENGVAVIMPLSNLKARPANYLLLVWPLPLILFECYNLPLSLKRAIASNRVAYHSRLIDVIFAWFYRILKIWMAILTDLTCLCFSILVVSFLIATQVEYQRTSLYLLAAAMFVGWMFTIVYTRGFETVHSLSTMLQHIIINDVTRFLFIYAFVLTGFGFAIHSLMHLSSEAAEKFPNAWHSLFFTFNLMVGMADHDFDHQFDTSYYNSGSRSIWVKIVYILYMILATVILLNMLIAMLSDTYSGVAASETSSWRVGSLKLALQIESSMPFIPAFFTRIGLTRQRVKLDDKMKRYVISNRKSMYAQKNIGSRKEAAEALFAVELRVNQLSVNQDEISRKLDTVIQVLQMETTSHGQAAKRWLGSRGTQNKSLADMLSTARPKSSRMRKS